MPSSTSCRSKSGTAFRKAVTCSDDAEAHDRFDPGPIVPTAVEQADLALRRKMLDVALEIPLVAFPLRRSRQGDDVALARIERTGEHVDRAALAGGIAAFEHHDQPLLGFLDPARRIAQFMEQRLQRLLILFLAQAPLPAPVMTSRKSLPTFNDMKDANAPVGLTLQPVSSRPCRRRSLRQTTAAAGLLDPRAAS